MQTVMLYPILCVCVLLFNASSAIFHIVIAENKALRVTLKAFYTPGERRITNQDLYRMYGGPSITERIQALNSTALLQRYSESTLRNDLDKIIQHMAWHRKATHPRVSELVDLITLNLEDNLY